MIVTGTDGGLRFVTQPAHARLAGRFADRWGGGPFDPPAPRPAVAMAAHRHDDGWWRYDRRPHLDAAGDPVDFRSTPPETWIDLYTRGIESAVDLDPYAGLLVSLHGAGLRRRRYGLSPSWPATPPAFAAFVESEEARQRDLLAELRDSGRADGADAELLRALHRDGRPPAECASRLWRNYALLQAWDALSLALCGLGPEPDERRVDDVPTGDGGRTVTLSVVPLGDAALRVEPYPFDAAPLRATVPARTVPADAVDDERSLLEAYYRAEREPLRFALRPPD
ncbi:MAG: DUF3891 family protein [Halobacteriales archaeon]